jgi:hypothetical protein
MPGIPGTRYLIDGKNLDILITTDGRSELEPRKNTLYNTIKSVLYRI